MPNPSQVSVIIPVASYHTDIAERAITSVRTQTAPCTVIRVDDPTGRGPSWARNRGLEQAETPFVVFLDADDWLEPAFVEKCLSAWKTGHYVYTDWFEGDKIVEAPLDAWCGNGAWHCITTLLPKYAAEAVGGFTSLPGAEDTEFYWAITRRYKVCGIRLAEPLFHYGEHGRRAKAFKDSDQYNVVMQNIIRSYGQMSCCTDQIIQASLQEGQQPGDVLARAIWGGNQTKYGRATQRRYRGGNGSLMAVDPVDIQATPNWWQVVNVPVEAPDKGNGHLLQTAPVAHTIDEIVRFIAPNARKVEPTLQDLQQVTPVHSAPNFSRVIELARRAYAS